MKCPKCGYLGFETTERCRHCGYDFSLTVAPESASELPLRPESEPEAPLSDFELRGLDTSATNLPPAGLDLDRVIGDLVREAPAPAAPAALIAPDAPDFAPPPARPPLAVRRSTPEVARRRTPRAARRDDGALALQLESPAEQSSADDQAIIVMPGTPVTASRGARILAALIDGALLSGIDLGVIYLTLAIAGLSFVDARLIPPIPMAAFLLLLNGGYLVAFTAAHGQTIGKMLTQMRVVGDEGGRPDVSAAVLRSAAMLLSVVLLGLPYLPVLLARDGRALHDRLAHTRVVKLS